MVALQQDHGSLRPTFPNAYDYYSDYYSEKEENTFRITKDSWENIHRSNNLNQKLTETDLKLISLVSALVKHDSLERAYFSLEYLCAKLDITDRQLRTVRKNINHIFSSRWRKVIRIDGELKKKVYVFTYTLQGREILGYLAKCYTSVKVGSTLPTSIYKDEKYINNRSSESTFYKNFNASTQTETTSKIIPLKQQLEPSTICRQLKLNTPNNTVSNKRKKPINAEIKANRAKLYRFKQYQEPKSLSDHYPLTIEECSELQSRSGREFTLNAMNEILLDMSKRLKESKHEFPSKTAFMAYMTKVYRYEGRDAVKTANSDFKILARATKDEVIAYTSLAQRNDFMATFEEMSIKFPTPENIFKTKIACTLPPMIGYNFLSNLKTVCKVGDIFEAHMSQNVLLTDHSQRLILSAANAVGGYSGVKKLGLLVKQEG